LNKKNLWLAKINAGKPTAVSRDPADQKITEQGQTGTESQQANEEYCKHGMTKIDEGMKPWV
jgi:hypothetical protein